MSEYDYAVIGGGMLGAAIGYGLARQGAECAILDAHDRDLRAARGNFGLVWVQSKGGNYPQYARWTRRAAALWPSLAEELRSRTGIDVQYQQRGGIHYCLNDADLDSRQQMLQRLAAASDGEFSFEMLDHNALKSLEPAVGPTVAGASWSPLDGHVNPLYLLRALHSAFLDAGGQYRANHNVSQIHRDSEGFRLETAQGEVRAQKLVLAAGLENARLAPMVGLQQKVFPQRGQVLITERLDPLLNYPSNWLRQTAEGTVQIGDSKEAVGLDDSQTVTEMANMAKRACRIIPALSGRRLVRGWGALRVLTDDGYPLYEAGDRVWAFSSHSGVTLAAGHVMALGEMLHQGQFSAELDAFSAARFQD